MKRSNSHIIRNFLFLVINFQIVTGILRNPVTNRCIHVGNGDRSRNDNDNKLVVTAHSCSFRNSKTGRGDNPDQWVEIVPLSKQPQPQQYTIQKHFGEESIVCIQTLQDESITTGDCKSSDSILLITKIPETSHNKRPSYESMFPPGAIFTIEQPDSGKCLSVIPGLSELQLTNCSQANAFQRWIACRHGGACDVDITWSPARIIFPKDPYNSSSDFEMSIPTPTQNNNNNMQKLIGLKDKSELTNPTIMSLLPSTITKTVPPVRMTSTSRPVTMENEQQIIPPKIIINELLYFVHNGLQVLKLPESKLISIITNFYTREEILEALDTLKANFFMISIDPRSISVSATIQVLHWMKQLTSHELDTNVIFASERISRVPSILATNNNNNNPTQPPIPSTTTTPSFADLKKIKNVKGRVENNINSVLGKLEDLKEQVLSDLDQLVQKNNSSSSTSSEAIDGKEQGDEMTDVIDLRLGQNNKQQLVQRRRYYE